MATGLEVNLFTQILPDETANVKKWGEDSYLWRSSIPFSYLYEFNLPLGGSMTYHSPLYFVNWSVTGVLPSIYGDYAQRIVLYMRVR
jgi:hypothetical protein